MPEIIPTVVPASLDDVAGAMFRYEHVARMLHVDFADGVFAPSTTWMPTAGDVLRAMPWEAHLMAAEPRELGLSCIRSGATRVIGHVEAVLQNAPEILSAWRKRGALEAGLALLAQTPLEALDPFLADCDFTMLMSIQTIGVQGLPFDEHAPARVSALRARHPGLPIEVDGSVNETTIAALARAGARRFCVGSALSKSSDPKSTYRSLMDVAGSAIH